MIGSIKHIKLDQTCGVCPEQYDVYNEGQLIGYIRYRYGWIKANPAVDGEYLFDEDIVAERIGGGYDSILPDDSREKWLRLCIDKIIEYHNNLERATVEETELPTKQIVR